jgi:hypothetical protein
MNVGFKTPGPIADRLAAGVFSMRRPEADPSQVAEESRRAMALVKRTAAAAVGKHRRLRVFFSAGDPIIPATRAHILIDHPCSDERPLRTGK